MAHDMPLMPAQPDVALAHVRRVFGALDHQATLTCVDGRSRAVPAFPPESAFRTAQQRSMRAVCHAPGSLKAARRFERRP